MRQDLPRPAPWRPPAAVANLLRQLPTFAAALLQFCRRASLSWLRDAVSREKFMVMLMRASLALGLAAVALGVVTVEHAAAADLMAPQGQYQQGGYPTYAPPPVAMEGYDYPPPPPPAAYVYPPPPPAAYPYPAPGVVVVPAPYYYARPYFRSYAPHVAYGYGHWGHRW